MPSCVGCVKMAMVKELIKLENVWKIYKLGETHVEALRGISLKIKQGEFVSIIGPSGSGKSTCMHIMGCLDTPTKGKVWLDNKEVSRLSENEMARIRGRRIGFVFQFFNLIPTLNALENVMLPMLFQGKNERERMKRAKELLERVGLGHRLYHRPNQLSGGEQQRVAIARALANDPDIILADEPTGNLDTRSGEEILKLFKEIHKDGKTVVVVTHDINIAKNAKRIIKIRDGKIVGGG